MLGDFFQLGSLPLNQMTGIYDARLVILSYLVATFASYIALDIAGRLRDIGNSPLACRLWIAGGAVAMGAGIWSMHFIGMLAFSMPGMEMGYDPFWTILSMFVAIGASAFALNLLHPQIKSRRLLILGGVILGCAIASMHYVGMEAMKSTMNVHYLPGLFALSVVIAIIASEAALWLALKSNQVVASMRFKLKFVSAFIMGAAICGMHFTGMAAAVFTPLQTATASAHMSTLNPQIMAIVIAGVTFGILAIAVFVSTVKEAQNQKSLSMARQAGMAEVAASVLHNVGNVLNSVNISAALIEEKITQSKLSALKDVSRMLNENKRSLGEYITQDPKGSRIPEYLTMLSQHWEKEQADIRAEASMLIRNIEHIKRIIAMQQSLSRVSKVEQLIDVDSTVDEALAIAGLNGSHPNIKVDKEVPPLKPILVDKVKLMQILVNVLRNAKEAVMASPGEDKQLSLKITPPTNGTIQIVVHDNGVGIAPADQGKLFSYGFTTKQSGHGFGLHSSALAAKEMGGQIKMQSDGKDKGATITVELPYKHPQRI